MTRPRRPMPFTTPQPAPAGGRPGPVPEASDVPDLIPQLAPLAFDQIIIAGSDEDVSAEELFAWVAPLLAGIPGGRWMSCQLHTCADGRVLAQYRNGTTNTDVSITIDIDAPSVRNVLRQLPAAQSVTMILLCDYASQAVMLLDSVAGWINIYDIDDDSIAPVLRLLGGFHTVLSKA